MTPAQHEIEVIRCYQSLFLGEHNDLKPEAEIVMRDLEKICGWMPRHLPLDGNKAVDPLRLAGDASRRLVYAHIKDKLAGPIEKLKRLTENQQ